MGTSVVPICFRNLEGSWNCADFALQWKSGNASSDSMMESAAVARWESGQWKEKGREGGRERGMEEGKRHYI